MSSEKRTTLASTMRHSEDREEGEESEDRERKERRARGRRGERGQTDDVRRGDSVLLGLRALDATERY